MGGRSDGDTKNAREAEARNESACRPQVSDGQLDQFVPSFTRHARPRCRCSYISRSGFVACLLHFGANFSVSRGQFGKFFLNRNICFNRQVSAIPILTSIARKFASFSPSEMCQIASNNTRNLGSQSTTKKHFLFKELSQYLSWD